jgi:hypothetical protein
MPTNWEPELTPSQVAVRLWQWGYFHEGCPGEEQAAVHVTDWGQGDMEDALAFFQSTYFDILSGMAMREGGTFDDDGLMDPYTEQLLETPRCGFPDTLPAMQSRYGVDPLQARWPDACKDEITFARLFETLNASLDKAGTDASFQLACESWTENLNLKLVINNALGRGASIWAGSGPLSGGVLAWSYLAQNSCAVHLEQRYNTRVDWTQRYLRAVACHEIGHALGLGHLQTEQALMYPYARVSVFEPATPDITAALQLGYKKRETPVPPTPGPTPAPDDPIVRLEAVFSTGKREHFFPAGSNGGGGTDW